MASRGRRKSAGVVEMARDLGVSTASVSRAPDGSPSVRRELAGLAAPRAKESAVTDGALAGLRVIDAATLAAGPLIATWLGEHGAEVIKVEQPDGGDPREYTGPTLRDHLGIARPLSRPAQTR